MRIHLLAILSAALTLPGCAKKDPLYCDESTPCTDPALPFCDLQAEYPASEGIRKTCIPDPFPDAGVPMPDAGPPCSTPDAFLRCDGEVAVTCNATSNEDYEVCTYGCNAAAERCNDCASDTQLCKNNQQVICASDGTVAELRDCPLGCHDTDERCWDIDPSNELGQYLDLASTAASLTLTAGAVINTDTGTITDGNQDTVLVPSYSIPAPQDGVPIRVFVVKSLTASNVGLAGSPAVAIVADGPINITGAFDLRLGRPGAVRDQAANCRGKVGTFVNYPQQGYWSQAGNGGGGYATAGGRGGDVGPGTSIPGGAAGAAWPNPDLVPLRGGCPGASYSEPGGAIQLVSRTSIVLNDGIINANGQAGDPQQGYEAGGGGSGGGILLEAPTVELLGESALVANGGGGTCRSALGQHGQVATTRALGGVCNSVDGGAGGSAEGSPDDGELATRTTESDYVFGGGGGGSAGHIRINTLDGTFTSSNQAILSPAPGTDTVGKH